MASKKKTTSLGCLFWIFFILLLIVVFFVKRDTISRVLENSGATHLFSGKKVTVQNGDGTVVPQIRQSDTPPVTPAREPASGDGSADAGTDGTKPAAPDATATPGTPTDAPVPVPAPRTSPATSPSAPATKPDATSSKTTKPTSGTAAPPVQTAPAVRTAPVFFVTIDSDGTVLRKEVSREIPRNDSPLSETLKALIAGPNAAEAKRGMRSLIPAGTRLLSAVVKDGVATLNMSDEFQFNQYGIEGYLGQLSQIVFTATAWPTVKSVQFLIEGQRREYLGAEGVWIGTPLSRDKF